MAFGKSPKSTDTGAKTGAGAAPSSSAAATSALPSPSAAPVLPDGRSPVYLTGVNATKNTVSFDLIEFLTGDAAKAEWKKEHPDEPNGPDNDYMIINKNKKLRTLPVAADAKCVVLSTGPQILPALVQRALTNQGGELLPFDEARRQFERDYLIQLLKLTAGNVTQAAKLARRNRTDFYALLARHQVEPGAFKLEA